MIGREADPPLASSSTAEALARVADLVGGPVIRYVGDDSDVSLPYGPSRIRQDCQATTWRCLLRSSGVRASNRGLWSGGSTCTARCK
jgi:hypothetical protein